MRFSLPLFLLFAFSLSACNQTMPRDYRSASDEPEDAYEGDDDDATGDEHDDDDDDTAPVEEADDDDAAEPPADDDEDPVDPPGPTDCTYDQFPVMIHQALQDEADPTHPLFVYQARTTDQVPFDELQMLSYQAEPYFGPTTPGTVSLWGNNYADCAFCALVITDCDESYSCDQVFFADEGTVQINAMAGGNMPFEAVLQDVVFREVTIDPATYESTPVPGGDTWCVDGLAIDVMTNLVN